MCIDVLIRKIIANQKIPSIRIRNLHIPKIVAFADDISVMTINEGIQGVFDTYDDFSDISGLKLNVDKTEIINLKTNSSYSSFTINNYSNTYTINALDRIKICGVTFSTNSNIETNENILSKIDKLENALSGWRKRSLSIFGRNLILKTFGLSQLIYSMQNTSFTKLQLDKINRICFQFLWNKKADKTRAYERVSRCKLILPKKYNGLSAPCIHSINKALKVKQLIRSLDPNNSHFIKNLQLELITPAIFNKINTKSLFLNDAITYINDLGKLAINEITADTTLLYNKQYYDLIASSPLDILIENLNNNLIARQYCKIIRKELGVVNVKHFINEVKFPRSEKHIEILEFIRSSCKKLFSVLECRKFLDDDTNILDGIPTGINKITKVTKLTTKVLTQRFMFELKNLDETVVDKLRYGLHPKENEIHWLFYHKACLSNAKLHTMKLIESPLCPVCLKDQTTEHIFFECTNSLTLWNLIKSEFNITINESEFLLGSPDKRINDIILLCKRLLFVNRDKKLDKNFIRSSVTNRLDDINSLLNKSKRTREHNAIKRSIINSVCIT
jgi:hypothetical protein